jgi:hypothetical protein
MSPQFTLFAPMLVGTLKAWDLPEFKWINTVLSNLKTLM